jgi:hypothetical protein
MVEVFHRGQDNEAFFSLLTAAKARRSVKLFLVLPDAESFPQALDLMDL